MIATSMLNRQVWIGDDDEFDHIVKHSQRVLRLNNEYENHPYVEEFKKECNVMFVYGICVLEGEADAKFFGEVMYGIYFRDAIYQTTQAIFAGK